MEANNQTWQDKYERALLQNQNKNHSHNAQNRYKVLPNKNVLSSKPIQSENYKSKTALKIWEEQNFLRF